MVDDKLVYPKGERVMVGYIDHNKELKYIITCKEVRDYYFLYERSGNEFKKLGKAKEPTQLELKFNIFEKMGWKLD